MRCGSHNYQKTQGIITFIAMRPSRTYLGPTRRLEIIKKHKELLGLLRFGPSKGILRHDIIKKQRNYNVYCDVGHTITQKLNKTTGFLAFLRCGPPGDPRSPQGPPRSPLGAPKSPLGAPKAALGTPNASPRDPKSSPRPLQGTNTI